MSHLKSTLFKMANVEHYFLVGAHFLAHVGLLKDISGRRNGANIIYFWGWWLSEGMYDTLN